MLVPKTQVIMPGSGSIEVEPETLFPILDAPIVHANH